MQNSESEECVRGGSLEACGEHERISPGSLGKHGYAANSQDGVSPTAAARCLPNPVRRDSLSTLSTRRHNHETDRKSTRLNSSHRTISYAVFCLKKKKKKKKKTIIY